MKSRKFFIIIIIIIIEWGGECYFLSEDRHKNFVWKAVWWGQNSS